MILKFPYPLSKSDFDRLEPWMKELSRNSVKEGIGLCLYTLNGGTIISPCDGVISLVNLLTPNEYDKLSHRDVLEIDLGKGLFLGFTHVFNPYVKLGDIVQVGTPLALQDPYFARGDNNGRNHFHFDFYELIDNVKTPLKVEMFEPK